MKLGLSWQRMAGLKGFTGADLLTVAGLVALLGLVIWPILNPPRVRSCRINCASNLKSVGLAFRMWANDYQERFPWQVSTNDGGTRELIGEDVTPHFRAIDKELSTPKVLTCNSDSRTRVASWDQFNASSLSYFVGFDANETRPLTLLTGDRNVTTNGWLAFGLAKLNRNTAPGWSRTMHISYGNVGFADGSAQQLTPEALREQWKQQFASITNDTVRLGIP